MIEVLGRVQFERGQLFRNITESSLQEEIATDGALSPDQSTSEDEGGDEENADQAKNGQPMSREQLQRAKLEMMQQVGVAHNEIMMALDFVSLLESEHAPQAQNSMSQALKDSVPPKTLGTDVWARMPVDEARQAQDRVLARNVKMRSLQRSADDILGAAKRLEDNVRKETQFWDQMLSISGKGWSICRIPRTKRLGVRYGFSESASEFSGRNVAALNSNSDGSISLERGFGSKPSGLRITVLRDERVVGRSFLPSTSDDSETTLEARIRHARDSIFDEELFREMTRESRTMASLGVKMKGQTIRLSTNASKAEEIHMDLVPLDQETGTSINTSNPDDNLAQAVALGARLILSQAHRDKLEKRSQLPPPMSDRNEEKNFTSILKPLATFLIHKSSLSAVNAYTFKAGKALKSAELEITISRAKFELSEDAATTSAKDLIAKLKSPFTSTAHIEIKTPDSAPTITMDIAIETSVAESQNTNSTITLTIPHEQALRFDDVDDLAQNTDAALASLLAGALRTQDDREWALDDREAVLVREAESAEESMPVWVAVDSEAGKVILSDSRSSRLTWTVGDEPERGPASGFWNAWRTVAD